MLTIEQVVTEAQIREVQALFAEYFEFLRTEVDTDVADLDDAPPMAGYREELAELPGKYAPPEGRLLLARYEAEAAGCVALYKLGEGVCEVKRMWTRPQFRGRKVGRRLIETLIAEARAIGYTTMLLSTVDILKEAQSLYRSVGFEPTAPYFDMPDVMLAHEVFLKLDLTR
jgi:GNAT superfamily N-acetyltransferase